jgi:RepB DNA-primase from phage plasmid
MTQKRDAARAGRAHPATLFNKAQWGTIVTAPVILDRAMADRFLRALAPETECFTFQTFTDSKQLRDQYKAEGRRDPLARVLHGTLSECWEFLVQRSNAGAGIYVVVNETNLRGRTAQDITRVRAYVADLDDAPLDNLKRLRLRPHIITQTSPGRYQAYWLVRAAALDHYKDIQRRLAKLVDADTNVCDLPRVMRLPGFPHQKQPDQPFMVEYVTAP